ncbi:MAG: CotH kinase family protein, partial [Acutalibacter sp.]|nr:CotH kinase family protein [Acutalibacter sp.]
PGPMGMGSSDVKLQYIDDDPESYPNIWENAKTDMTEADQRRLIQSLKKLSAGEDLSSVVDIQQVIRYFVVHNYVCNDDSYTGAMVHNYYLYEEEGRLAMLPWDYNLAFGTFGGGDAGSVVNTPIDAPVSGDASDRPMWSWIVENEEYAQLYHQYFAEFLSTVDIEDMITQAYQLIRSYVAKDPTAFYSYEEFELGVETLRQFCALRSESIAAQLANGETASPMNYADASAITLSDMGTMNGGMGGSPGKAAGRGEAQEESPSEEQAPPSGEEEASGSSEASGSNRSFGGNMQPPGGNFSGGGEASPSPLSGWLWMGGSVLILGLGLLVTRMYKA